MMNRKEEISNSVSSIYKELMDKRKKEKDERKLNKKEETVEETVDEKEDKIIKLSKKERRQMEMDNWKSVISNLIGDDLVYEEKKPKKKKYRKWIDEEDDNKVIEIKQKKAKKRNYQKEFDPELTLLRNLISDQNKFNQDLQKRFNIAMGPATKDGAPPNKTMVELASAIVAGRNNSLGILKEIGSLKKNIADLYMKQKKLNYDLHGDGNSSSNDNGDLMLIGSNIMSSFDNKFLNQPSVNSQLSQQPIYQNSTVSQHAPQTTNHIPLMNNSSGYEVLENVTPKFNTQPGQNINIQEFDPSSWNSSVNIDKQVLFENIPKSIVVEKNSQTGSMRFKAIDNNSGAEIIDYPGLPTSDPRELSINEKDGYVKGKFDETYKLVTV